MPSPRPSPWEEGANAGFLNKKALLFILREFFFCFLTEAQKIGPLRLNVAEKKHGRE
jgi:hypothetical protein